MPLADVHSLAIIHITHSRFESMHADRLTSCYKTKLNSVRSVRLPRKVLISKPAFRVEYRNRRGLQLLTIAELPVSENRCPTDDTGRRSSEAILDALWLFCFLIICRRMLSGSTVQSLSFV